MRALVVDADAATAAQTEEMLREEGMPVDRRTSATSGVEAASKGDHSLVVVDSKLPDARAAEAVEEMREAGVASPVIVTSGGGGGEDPNGAGPREAEQALDSGADDFVRRPIEAREFRARVRALLRRGGPGSTWVGRLTVDAVRHLTTVGGRPLRLSAIEQGILEALAAAVGRPVSRAELGRRIYGPDQLVPARSIEGFMWRIRKRLEAAGATGIVATKRGAGYMLDREKAGRGEAGPQRTSGGRYGQRLVPGHGLKTDETEEPPPPKPDQE